MRRVTGIGGVFFYAHDPEALQQWYKTHLGVDVSEWGGAIFRWADADGVPTGGSTVWSIMSEEDAYFAPGTARFMVNYRVEDLDAVLAALRAEGCNVVDRLEESEFGRFGWVIDPEGNKVELWQPPAGQ